MEVEALTEKEVRALPKIGSMVCVKDSSDEKSYRLANVVGHEEGQDFIKVWYFGTKKLGGPFEPLWVDEADDLHLGPAFPGPCCTSPGRLRRQGATNCHFRRLEARSQMRPRVETACSSPPASLLA